MYRALVIGVTLFLALPASANAARLYLETDTRTYGLGDTFVATVRLDTEGACLNAVHVDLAYPQETLRAVDFGRGGSILTLWVEEPQLNKVAGRVSFSGGVPGGYCGRTPGDPVTSNILGKIVFTVVDVGSGRAALGFTPSSIAYENDGLGTRVPVSSDAIEFTLLPEPTLSENKWLLEVESDTIPPDAFDVQVDTTGGILGARYYAIFSTVDKQSGLDHYEIFERGGWKSITSPYELKYQSLDSIQVKAVDKAGNERLGDYAAPEGATTTSRSPTLLLTVLGIILLLGLVKFYMDRRESEKETTLETPPSQES